MQAEIRIELAAVNPARNCARAWSVELGQDLFGRWQAQVAYGRIGAAGRRLVCAFATREEADRFLRASLRRRMTARRRLGVSYACINGCADGMTYWRRITTSS